MIDNLVYSGRDAKSVADENYLDKEFKTNAPRKACVSDLTYMLTEQGWLYLTMIMDLFDHALLNN